MVRFSCFNAHIHNHKTKKTGQPTIVTMQKMLQDCSQIQVPKDSPTPESAQVDMQINSTAQHSTTSPSVESGSKSEEMKIKFNIESDMKVHRVGHLKKSQSLGSALYQHCKVSGDNDMEDETEQGYSCDGSYHNTLVLPYGNKDPEVSVSDRFRKNPSTESLLVTSADLLNNDSIFSLGEQVHPEKDAAENSDTVLSGEYAGDYGNRMPSPSHAIVKSSSLPNIVASTHLPGVDSSFNYIAPRSRSSEDLHVLEIRRRESSAIKVEAQVIQDQTKDNVWRTERNIVENPIDDGYESCNYASSAKDWVVPVVDDEVNSVPILKGESSTPHWEELPSKDFKIKRIEDWVTDLQYCDPVEEETIELDSSDNQVQREPNVPNGLSATKVDEKLTPGMEAAKRYISSLSAATTTAQLANHGLSIIPFLSAFVSLRVLNLSGNAIVKITAGALPRGLHMLNLSKNFISTIEGLRELTRLRVLDLSYNRIFRIGHGLASCSSLKELYLAGNKISEVEGLHRLLKLTVLDLRFNKISTAKCLGQLAANYNSLQAISLEGNPAQKNVGDEQLKKSLQGLLPNLAYYNRQPMKVSTLKEAPERSVRLGVSAHQFDRGLAKGSRKGSQGSHKPTSSTHGRKSQAMLSPKPTRARVGHGHAARLPPNPTGTKASIQRHHHFDLNNKLLSYRSGASMRRSRSEGTLGAL